jgi:hypothetical protein
MTSERKVRELLILRHELKLKIDKLTDAMGKFEGSRNSGALAYVSRQRHELIRLRSLQMKVLAGNVVPESELSSWV